MFGLANFAAGASAHTVWGPVLFSGTWAYPLPLWPFSVDLPPLGMQPLCYLVPWCYLAPDPSAKAYILSCPFICSPFVAIQYIILIKWSSVHDGGSAWGGALCDVLPSSHYATHAVGSPPAVLHRTQVISTGFAIMMRNLMRNLWFEQHAKLSVYGAWIL